MESQLMKCQECEGKRVTYGFGGMKHPCKTCNGVGVGVKVDNAKEKADKRTKEYREQKEA